MLKALTACLVGRAYIVARPDKRCPGLHADEATTQAAVERRPASLHALTVSAVGRVSETDSR